MAKVEGIGEVASTLRKLAREAAREGNVSVNVGFTQSYAVYVHENLEARHTVGQAKFLEQPMRTNAATYAEVIRKALAAGRTVSQALLLSGLMLQRDAQKLCPVKTGALKASAFTRIETR